MTSLSQATQTNNLTERNPAVPPNFRHDAAREPFIRSQGWGWFSSAAAHYGTPGEGPGLGASRIKLLTCGSLNYCSPKFQSHAKARAVKEQNTLNLTSAGFWKGVSRHDARAASLKALTRKRRLHTLEDVSKGEATMMKDDSERVLKNLLGQAKKCSGLDWTTITNEIVQTYALSLSQLLQSLQNYSASNYPGERKCMSYIRDRTHSILLPFLEYPSLQARPSTWARDPPSFKQPIPAASITTYDSSLS